MRLKVSYYSNVPEADAVWYHITPNKQYPYEVSPSESAYLERLQYRISSMAQLIIPDEFIRVDRDQRVLTLGVKKGTSTGPNKFKFRSLCGWIELFSIETAAAVRGFIPRAN